MDAVRTLARDSIARAPMTTLESGVNTSTTLARLVLARMEPLVLTKALHSIAFVHRDTQVTYTRNGNVIEFVMGARYNHTCDYSVGKTCEDDIIDCKENSCPPSATCIDLTGKFFCQCPFNLTGDDCRKCKRVSCFL